MGELGIESGRALFSSCVTSSARETGICSAGAVAVCIGMHPAGLCGHVCGCAVFMERNETVRFYSLLLYLSADETKSRMSMCTNECSTNDRLYFSIK